MAEIRQDDKPSGPDTDGYIFNRNYKSSLRLNFNHFLMREVAGYLIHPQIPVDKPSLRIADVGSGTGIWACEVASKFSKAASIDAFDISDGQYPAAGLRPKSVQFIVHDGFKDYPSQYLGQYDIVHARFWLCLVNDPMARPLLKQLLSLVKPGGYLQWFEPLPRSTKVIATQDGAETTASARLAQTWHKPTPTSEYDWVEGLADLFKEEGLQEVSRTVHEWSDWLRPLWAQSSLLATEDVLTKVDSWNEKEGGMTLQFMSALQKELAQGVTVDTPFQCVVGRKAV